MPIILPATLQDEPSHSTTEAAPTAPPLVPGSAVAKALANVWGGRPVTVLQAPPGAGKTTAVVTLVHHLAERVGLRVAAVCPTRSQALDLYGRLSESMGSERLELQRSLGGGWKQDCSVMVRTVASLMTEQTISFDVVVVDEAYQVTFDDVARAASGIAQIVLVGDPGQIGPVVKLDPAMWPGRQPSPMLPAPVVFGARDDASTFSMDATFRLGPVTTRAIAPLYPFAFESRRPDRQLQLAGEVVPEVVWQPVPPTATPDDPALLEAVVARVAELTAADPQRQFEVAVVAARNSQTTAISALLDAQGLTMVRVGTADLLQGGEWAAVVALDPIAGVNGPASGHALHLGRLCVMASRHTHHLSWITTDDWQTLLSVSDLPEEQRQQSWLVRSRLAGLA